MEAVIEPDLPIIDAHHHLWYAPKPASPPTAAPAGTSPRSPVPVKQLHPRYLLDELVADFSTGHNIRASVFVEAHAMYRTSGPAEMKSVGEIEFANGVAAMAASGLFGEARVCAGIVGSVDLRLGDAVEGILAAHLRAGGERYRGIRSPGIFYDEDERLFPGVVNNPHVLLDKGFRTGFKYLQGLGLTFDAFVLEPQLPELIDLARAFPETPIILNHVGTPLGMARYEGRREERFPIWRDNIRLLSRCLNVTVKLGGLGMAFCGFKSYMSVPAATSSQLVDEWTPYIETCIDAFGAHRCMFESNFPVDAATTTYPVLWNSFKRMTAGASKDEKTALFSGTAKRIYRLDI